MREVTLCRHNKLVFLKLEIGDYYFCEFCIDDKERLGYTFNEDGSELVRYRPEEIIWIPKLTPKQWSRLLGFNDE